MSDFVNLLGRIMVAILFLGGAVQKVFDPAPVMDMIMSLGLPANLVWPVAAFNLVAALSLIVGPGVRSWAIVLALALGALGSIWMIFHVAYKHGGIN